MTWSPNQLEHHIQGNGKINSLWLYTVAQQVFPFTFLSLLLCVPVVLLEVVGNLCEDGGGEGGGVGGGGPAGVEQGGHEKGGQAMHPEQLEDRPALRSELRAERGGTARGSRSLPRTRRVNMLDTNPALHTVLHIALLHCRKKKILPPIYHYREEKGASVEKAQKKLLKP